jgi:hypothetical protein
MRTLPRLRWGRKYCFFPVEECVLTICVVRAVSWTGLGPGRSRLSCRIVVCQILRTGGRDNTEVKEGGRCVDDLNAWRIAGLYPHVV